MQNRERILASINHQQPDRIAFDLGSTPVTGIHVKVVEELRRHYGLPNKPVRVIEPFQMLGEIDNEILEILNIDTIGVSGPTDMFGHQQTDFIEIEMPWGQKVLLPASFKLKVDSGRLFVFPQGDSSCNPCAVMPAGGYFFDAIERAPQTEFDQELSVEDNLEEFSLLNDEIIDQWKQKLQNARFTGRAVVANFGGTGLGDIALVPGMQLKTPKGIRAISDWYMSTAMRVSHLMEIFDRQTDIAVQNLKRINEVAGDCVDVVFICGTDFGTQDSQFCSPETLTSLYGPYYRKMNDWIHQNTNWKTFKHCCGSIEPLIATFIDMGFDIINPVQINAKNMDPHMLKDRFGDRITFWGGGIDTQKMLPMGTPEEIKMQVKNLCEIFGQNGGFVFNPVHNIQANVPLINVIAMLDAINEIRK